MTKDKQIEEIAERIYGNGIAHDTAFREDCRSIARDLYEAGYRKQSEGENITENHPVDEFICEKCGFITRDCCRYEIDEDDGDEICYEFAFRFCPRCGMKVKRK